MNITTAVDTKRAADIIGVAPQTLNNWRCNGRGPAFTKAGRRVVYDLADIAAWKDERKRRNTQEGQAA